MKLFEEPIYKTEEIISNRIENIYEDKQKFSMLGMQLSNLVRNDEEYAKFNGYIK